MLEQSVLVRTEVGIGNSGWSDAAAIIASSGSFTLQGFILSGNVTFLPVAKMNKQLSRDKIALLASEQ